MHASTLVVEMEATITMDGMFLNLYNLNECIDELVISYFTRICSISFLYLHIIIVPVSSIGFKSGSFFHIIIVPLSNIVFKSSGK